MSVVDVFVSTCLSGEPSRLTADSLSCVPFTLYPRTTTKLFKFHASTQKLKVCVIVASIADNIVLFCYQVTIFGTVAHEVAARTGRHRLNRVRVRPQALQVCHNIHVHVCILCGVVASSEIALLLLASLSMQRHDIVVLSVCCIFVITVNMYIT